MVSLFELFFICYLNGAGCFNVQFHVKVKVLLCKNEIICDKCQMKVFTETWCVYVLIYM